ncbi:MAG: hypothetical protein OEY56_01670, partial [Cyclobacteriaceae bacterium]|nr:hypothetical protein [Cyclobacteriaceae bacterium]
MMKGLFAILGVMIVISCESTIESSGSYLNNFSFDSNERMDTLLRKNFYKIHTQLSESILEGEEIYRLTVSPSFAPPFVIKVSQLSLDTLYEVHYKSLKQFEPDGVLILGEDLR